MKCQLCGMREATTHIKQTINSVVSEWYVCSKCAMEQGLYNNVSPHINAMVADITTPMYVRKPNKSTVCSMCSMSLEEILNIGRVGCPHCYQTFREELLPSIQRIHGKTEHCGKSAKTDSFTVQKTEELSALKEELKQAIASQEYERCALIRDQIRELEGGA